MNQIGDIFNLLLLQPTINLIILILRGLESMHISGALGFSIIFLTLIISIITWPFRSSQLKNMKRTSEIMAELKPKLDELKKLHKDNKLAFSQAQAALLKEHGVNPAAGCLPSLIPILLIIPLYQVIFAFFDGAKGLEKINYFLYTPSWKLEHLPDLHFFGVNLATKPSEFAAAGVAILLVPVITAFLTLIQSLMMSPKPVKPTKEDSLKEIKQKEDTQDMTSAMQSQMVFMMPAMIGFFAFQLPIGLAIYWNTLTILGIIQQHRVSGWGKVADLVKKYISQPKNYK